MDERRHFDRVFPRRTSLTVGVDGKHLELQILNESDGGVGLFSASDGVLSVGSKVEVRQGAEHSRQAVVRYIHPHPNGGYQIGLMWADDASGAKT